MAICKASISDCPISHVSQLDNSSLGLPLEYGKCESCGTAELDKCEGYFGCIELPIPVYHPFHVSELRQLLSLLCLKCLNMKKSRLPHFLETGWAVGKSQTRTRGTLSTDRCGGVKRETERQSLIKSCMRHVVYMTLYVLVLMKHWRRHRREIHLSSLIWIHFAVNGL